MSRPSKGRRGSTCPYTLDGKHPSIGDALETFSILALVAGATERLRLVTSVLVLPYRNPLLTAKMTAWLDATAVPASLRM